MEVVGQPIVFDDSPKLLLKLGNDTEDRIVSSFLTVDGFTAFEIGDAFCANHVHKHSQPRTRPYPSTSVDLHKSGVATPTWPEAVGSVAELRLIVCLKDEAHDLLKQLARDGR